MLLRRLERTRRAKLEQTASSCVIEDGLQILKRLRYKC